MTEEQNKINNVNEDFISKKFVVKNLLFRSGGVEEYEIGRFIKNLDGKVEMENKDGKRVNANSIFKIVRLGIRHKDKFTIYCYGENQEKNLKEIEEFFKGIEVYPIEEIKENKNNKINNVVENTAKEKIMSNNDELTLNLLILVQMGVGKSSLVNALVGREVEKTSAGRPQTEKERKNEAGEIERGIYPHPHEIDGKKVVIYDSWGLEVDKATEWEGIIEEELKKRSADKDIKDWFHSVTYCIQAGGYKIQDFDIEIIKQFVDEGYNVIVALTKSDQLGKAKREEFIEIIKKEVKEATKKDIMVITVAGDPEQLDHMTEKPKPSGLEEYKAAILLSWEKIFIDRIPLHIIEKLKKDIENAKYNAPNHKPKNDDDLKILAKEIQEYFNNVVKENLQSRIKENFEKYYKITEDIININTDIDISNFYSRKNIDPDTYLYDYIGFSISHLFEHIKDLFKYLYNRMNIKENIEEFINKTYEETKEYISEKKFEDNIRKSIIDIFNKIENKKN